MAAKKKKWDDKKEGKKPWEHGYVAPEKPKAPGASTPSGPGGIGRDVDEEVEKLKKRNKKFAPYKDTGILPKTKKKGRK